MEAVSLTTARLLLRTPDDDDVDAIYQACQDADIQQWTTVPVPYLREHAEGFVSTMIPDGWSTDTRYAWCAYTRETGVLVSCLSLLRCEQRVFEIGYWTCREHRGKGYTAEAVDALARWAFTVLGAQRLEWQGIVGNPASWFVAEKVGFRREGTTRARVEQRGVRKDTWLGGLLPSDLGITT